MERKVVTRRGAVGWLGGAASLLLGGCGILGAGYRFKMTVEVNTPQGLRSGFSVFAVEASRTTNLETGGSGSDAELRGEAVAVDLPGGKTLFAILKTINPTNDDLVTMSMVSLDPAFDFDRIESAHRIKQRKGIRSPASVPADYRPILVTFGDVADPKSVKGIERQDIATDFASGHAVRSIFVSVTEEPVTNSLHKRLIWLGAYPERRLDNDFKPTTTPTLAQRLRYGDFARGTIT